MNSAFLQPLLAKNLAELGFSLEITQDGSPTLRLPQNGESMHHSGGAAAETKYIYGSVLDQAYFEQQHGKTGIVGLGLGYIEIAWALSLIKNHLIPSGDIKFDSFEIISELKENFLNWLNSGNQNFHVYDLIVEKMAPHIESKKVKNILKMALQTGSSLRSDLSQFQLDKTSWNVICFDAFSKKTNEGLWSFDFLDSFIKQSAAQDCVFTTYACTGLLKKTLQLNDFLFFKKPGFSGKRDSSLATRGVFKTTDFQSTICQTFSCNQ